MAVTRLEIKSRQPFDGGQSFGEVGPYDLIDGVAYFAVDPNSSANEPITDLKLASRDGRGQVSWSADFRILYPQSPERSNHRLLLDVLNRGRGRALTYFNLAADNKNPLAPPEAGDGFLNRLGYTVVWCGWQHDVPPAPGLMRLQVPKTPVTGKVAVTFQPNAPTRVQLLADRMHQPYPTSNLNDSEATLTVQEDEDAPPEIIPRSKWYFARLKSGQVVADASHIYLGSGFEPSKVYQVIYTATGAPVAGLGLLTTRDLVSFLRHATAEEGNPCAGNIQHAYSFGASQSGRFLRHFLYLGLNQDEADRTVFEGLIPHIAGGRRGEFNQRFGQPSSLAKHSTSNLFPFSDTEQTDLETGQTGGLLSRLASRGKVPRIFFTNTSSEYWGGHAALTHVDLSGSRDIEPMESVRIYHYAGTQHASGTFPLADDNEGARGQQFFNCVDYRPLSRAALVRLDRWVTTGELPPPSCHPQLADSTAVAPESLTDTFRAIPRMNFPTHFRHLNRLDFGPDEGVLHKLPTVVGKPYPDLVAAVDRDGNEVAGIRLPDITVPLATHTGWNLRHPSTGAPGQIMSNTGSTIPFPATRAERQASGDPRLSIEERYPSQEDYLERVRQAAQELVNQGYLLAEDVDVVAENAAKRYDVLAGPVAALQTADD